MNYSAHYNSGTSRITRGFLRIMAGHLPVIFLPFIALSIAHFYGPFIWGSFFREFLWVMSLAFVLQSGSNQMLILSPLQSDLETEFRLSVQSRIMIFAICCLIIFLLPVSIIHLALLISMLLFRVGGDTLLGYQRANGNISTVVIAEFTFWILFTGGIIILNDHLSVMRLMEFAAIASAGRFIMADPRAFGKIIPLEKHSPDADWLKEAFTRFLPLLCNFTFYSIDLLLASFLLTVSEFSNYQLCVLCILAAGMIINSIYNVSTDYRKTLQQLITFSALTMVPVSLLLKFILEEVAFISLSPWFILAAWVALISYMLTAYFLRWLMEDREQKFIMQVFLLGTILYCGFLPWLFMQYGLNEFLLGFAAVQAITAICFVTGSFAKGYK